MMTNKFISRLKEIPEHLASSKLIHSKNIGNEIGFYIFDYPPDQELVVRNFINSLESQINKKSDSRIDVFRVNIFDCIINYMKDKKYYDRIIKMQKEKGNDGIKKGLASLLDDTTITKIFTDKFKNCDSDLVIMYGAGAVWPLIRMHSLLTILQPIIGQIPMVLFYPGTFDSRGLKLFNCLPSDNYYRAFRLIP